MQRQEDKLARLRQSLARRCSVCISLGSIGGFAAEHLVTEREFARRAVVEAATNQAHSGYLKGWVLP